MGRRGRGSTVGCNSILAHFCRPIDPSRLSPRIRHAVAATLVLIAIVLFGLGIGIVYMAKSGRMGSCCFPAGCNAMALRSSRLPLDNINGICLFSSTDASIISCPGAEWANLNSRCQLDNPDRCTTSQLSRLSGSVPAFAFTTGILLLLAATVVGGLCNMCSTDMRAMILFLFGSVVLLLCLAATLISLLSGWGGSPTYAASTLYFDRLGSSEAKFRKKQQSSTTTASTTCPFSDVRMLMWNSEGSVAIGLLGTAVSLAAFLVVIILGLVAVAGRCTGSCGSDNDVGVATAVTTGAPSSPPQPATMTTLAAPILVQPTFVQGDERPWYEKQSRAPDATTMTLTPSRAFMEEGSGGLPKTDSILLSFPARNSSQLPQEELTSGSNLPSGRNDSRGHSPTRATAYTSTAAPYRPFQTQSHSSWDEPVPYSSSHINWDANEF